MSQSIVTNTIAASLGRVVNILLGVVAISVITRLLQADSYGDYVLLLSYGTLLQIAADLGLYLTLTKKIGEDPEKEQSLLTHIASLRILLLVGVFIVGGLWVVTLPDWQQLAPAFLLIALGLIFQSISQLCMGVFQRHGIVWRATVGDLVGRVIQLVGLVALMRTHVVTGSTTLLALVSALFLASTAFALVVHARLLPISLSKKFKPLASGWKDIVQSSWPLGAMLLLNVIYFRSDTIILSFFRESSEVGYYGLAYRVIESTLFFPAMFGGLLLPQLSYARKKKNNQRIQKIIRESLHLVGLAAAGLAIVTIGLAAPIVVLLSGNGFLPAAHLLQILSIAMVVMFFGNIFGFVLVAYDKQKYLLKLYAALAIGNVIANVIFIPSFGAAAAAFTTVATEAAAATAAGLLALRATRAVPSPTSVVQIAAATTAGIVALKIMPNEAHVLIQTAVIATVFLAVAVSLGALSKKTISTLLQKTNRSYSA